MSQPQVAICHRVRLYSECLGCALHERHAFQCSVLLVGELAGALQPGAVAPAVQLVVLDATLVDGEAAALVDTLRDRRSSCKLLVLVPDVVGEQIVTIAQLGAEGCICEDSSLDEIGAAMRAILAGQRFVSPPLANALFVQIGRLPQDHGWGKYVDDLRLTAREQEILRLIAGEDLSNKQIARRLHVSLYTVKNHVHNIIRKLDAESRRDAARLAKRRRLVGVASLTQ
jgi:DNA-binding NarL/FixJ family response regulator